jgi:hypothetical protein
MAVLSTLHGLKPIGNGGGRKFSSLNAGTKRRHTLLKKLAGLSFGFGSIRT